MGIVLIYGNIINELNLLKYNVRKISSIFIRLLPLFFDLEESFNFSLYSIYLYFSTKKTEDAISKQITVIEKIFSQRMRLYLHLSDKKSLQRMFVL